MVKKGYNGVLLEDRNEGATHIHLRHLSTIYLCFRLSFKDISTKASKDSSCGQANLQTVEWSCVALLVLGITVIIVASPSCAPKSQTVREQKIKNMDYQVVHRFRSHERSNHTEKVISSTNVDGQLKN